MSGGGQAAAQGDPTGTGKKDDLKNARKAELDGMASGGSNTKKASFFESAANSQKESADRDAALRGKASERPCHANSHMIFKYGRDCV